MQRASGFETQGPTGRHSFISCGSRGGGGGGGGGSAAPHDPPPWIRPCSVNTYVGTFLRIQHTQNPCPYQRLCISADTAKRVLKILKSQCYHLEDGNQCPLTLLCEHRYGYLMCVRSYAHARTRARSLAEPRLHERRQSATG